MNIGQLRHRVLLQRPIRARDGYGDVQQVSGYENYASRWCAVRDLRANEWISAAALTGSRTVELVMRYDPALRMDWRIIHDDRILEIESIVNPDGVKREMLITCREVA